LDYKTVR